VRLTAAASVAVVLLLLSGPVAASVCEGRMAVSYIWPPSGEIRAPTNTLILVGSAWTDDGSTLELWRSYPVEEFIETTTTTVVAGPDEITVMHPAEELYHASYRLDAVRADGSRIELTIFATDDGPDTLDPARPGALVEPTPVVGETADCGAFARVELRMPFEATVMLLDVDDEDDSFEPGDDDDSAALGFFDPDAVQGALDAMIFEGGHPDHFAVGRDACLRTWPGAAPGEATRVRLAALDEAGNFSGWSDWLDVEVPREQDPGIIGPPPDEDDSGGGCAIGPGAPVGFASLLLVALAGLRRRWHTPPP